MAWCVLALGILKWIALNYQKSCLLRIRNLGEMAAETGSSQPPTADRPLLLFPGTVPLCLDIRPEPGIP
jgi:hypothetical protein